METQRQIKFAVKMGKILQVILFTPEMKMVGLCLGEGRDGGCSGREAERETETDRQTRGGPSGAKLQTGIGADVQALTFGWKTGSWKLSASLLGTMVSWKTEVCSKFSPDCVCPALGVCNEHVACLTRSPSSCRVYPPLSLPFPFFHQNGLFRNAKTMK